MKKFLTKLLTFILILLSYFILNILVNRFIISRSNLPFRDINILIAGDSHPRKALDPGFFNSAQNISHDAEPYYVTYWKLKFIIKKVNVDTLILGFCHHNFAASFNDKKLCAKNWCPEMFRIIYQIRNIRKIKNIEIDFGEFYKVYFQNMCLFPKKNHFRFFKEYSNSNRSNVSNFDVPIQEHFYKYKEDGWFSEIALCYLDSIIDLCRNNKVELILVASPEHKEYNKRVPTPVMDRFSFEKNKLMEQGLLVIDLSEDFYPDDYYFNTDHLNQKGASRFSAEIAGILRKRSQKSEAGIPTRRPKED
jgi:hypothetical protein